MWKFAPFKNIPLHGLHGSGPHLLLVIFCETGSLFLWFSVIQCTCTCAVDCFQPCTCMYCFLAYMYFVSHTVCFTCVYACEVQFLWGVNLFIAWGKVLLVLTGPVCSPCDVLTGSVAFIFNKWEPVIHSCIQCTQESNVMGLFKLFVVCSTTDVCSLYTVLPQIATVLFRRWVSF